MKMSAVFMPVLLVISPISEARGPTRQQVQEKITINAPPAQVWALVGDFGGLHKWHRAIKATAMEGEKRRVLILAGTGNRTISEELKERNAEKMLLKYRIVDQSIVKTVDFRGQKYEVPAVPVDNYSAIISVKPAGEGSEITWSGTFYRVYKLNYYKDEPRYPEGLGDDDAIKTITEIYKSGLSNLKKTVEGS